MATLKTSELCWYCREAVPEDEGTDDFRMYGTLYRVHRACEDRAELEERAFGRADSEERL